MTDRIVLDLTNQTLEFAEQVMKDLAVNATAEITTDNPVLTGWSRANWVPEIGVPFRGLAGTKEQAEAGSIDRSVQENGLARVLSYNINSGQSIYISNNVPYIIELNEGSSTQAPAMFVQTAIARAIQEVNAG